MSSNDATSAKLSVVDYVVFGLLLTLSAAVGVFFAYRDRKNKNSKNYLLANRKISWWASGLSYSQSFLAGSTIIGVPAEIMYRGSAYMWSNLGILMAVAIASQMFLPIYYKNEMSSANEYYGVRFGKYARYVATIIYILQTIAYTGVMIYAPALALNADFPTVSAVLSTGIVCTIYTTLGGLKAVIWTDVIQGAVLLITILVVLFVGANEVGGFGVALDIAWKGDRIDFIQHFEFDPRYRMTFWSAVFGVGIMWTSIASTNQAAVQRFLCCRSIKDGQMAYYVCFGLSFLQFGVILTLTGYVTYAYFSTCDPLKSNVVSAEDQVLPLLVMRVFSDIPGVPGLFIAGIYAGSLSTVSSAINGMSCVTTSDIIRPLVNWSDYTLLWISRGLTFIYGALCIGFAFLAAELGNVVQAGLSVLGLCAGALLGPIVIGTLCPLSNEKGAVVGMITALAFNIWIFVGAWIYPPPVHFLNLKPTSIEGCDVNVTDTTTNISSLARTTTSMLMSTTAEISPFDVERPAIADFYAVSFAYYAPMGLIVCVIVGLIISVLTGGLKSRHHVDPDLICLPFEHPLLRWLPKRFRLLMIPKMGERKQIPVDVKSEDDIMSVKEKVSESSFNNMAYENEILSHDTYL